MDQHLNEQDDKKTNDPPVEASSDRQDSENARIDHHDSANHKSDDHAQNEAEHAPDSHKKAAKETWEWIKALTIAVFIAIAIRMFLFAPIVVDGTSMVPTLEDGERLIVNKAIYYIHEPERGDILVFHAEQGKDWIKRVIGEPGDVVEVKDDQLFINGELVEEPYLEESKAKASGILTYDLKMEIPEGHLFVLGDNRQNSRDSRSIGPIEIDQVVGRAEVIFWPFKNIRIAR